MRNDLGTAKNGEKIAQEKGRVGQKRRIGDREIKRDQQFLKKTGHHNKLQGISIALGIPGTTNSS